MGNILVQATSNVILGSLEKPKSVGGGGGGGGGVGGDLNL